MYMWILSVYAIWTLFIDHFSSQSNNSHKNKGKNFVSPMNFSFIALFMRSFTRAASVSSTIPAGATGSNITSSAQQDSNIAGLSIEFANKEELLINVKEHFLEFIRDTVRKIYSETQTEVNL